MNQAGLLSLIGDRNALLTDRLNAADEMGLVDIGLYAAVCEEKQLLVDLLIEMLSPVVDDRHAGVPNVAHEAGQLIHRAGMHFDVSPVDYGAVESHLRDALELIEQAK